jgi:murein DD-endopeptidase MepM/ murein hydrolase activator NlpD
MKNHLTYLLMLSAALMAAVSIVNVSSTATLVAQSSIVQSNPQDSPVITASPFPGLKASQLHESFNEIHHGHRHQAIDIMEAHGTPIHAVVDGTIHKLFTSRAGGITIYEFDSSETYCYYYAHLDRYADGLHESMAVKHGQVLGYVGTTGNAAPDAPQLHLAIDRLGRDKRWWKGTPIDPYPVLLSFIQKASS